MVTKENIMGRFQIIATLFVVFSLPLFATLDEVDKVRQQNIEVVKAAAKELSAKLPQKVDEFTQLVDLKADGEKLVYTFEIHTGAKSDEAIVKEAKERQMKVRVTGGICRSSKRFLESGIGIVYIYRSAASKKPLLRYEVDRKACIDLLGPAY
jgi:hypothetical protein